MDWLLLWWLMSDDRYDEPEHPRYFREPKPREPTKEENRAGAIFFRRSSSNHARRANCHSRYWLPTVRCTKSFTLTIT